MRVRGPEQVILLLCCVITTYCFRPSIIGKRDATQSTSYEPGSSKRVDAGTSIDQPAPRNNINGRYVTERAASQPILRKRVDEDPRLQSRRRIYFVPVQNEGAGDQYEWDQKPRDSHSLNSYQLIRPLLEDSVYVVEGSRGQQFVLKWPDDLTGAEYKAQQRASDPKWRNENIVQLDRCIWQRPSNKRKPKIAKFLIMEYCPHPDLQQMIDDRKYPHTQDLTLFNSRVKEIFMDALNGLELLHKAQVAHLDIKPGNMMMVDADLEKKKSGIEYSVKLGDFGDASLKATETDVRGSPGFAPPESYDDENPPYATQPNDIYQMGMTMIYIATRTHLFKQPKGKEFDSYKRDRKAYLREHLGEVLTDEFLVVLEGMCMPLPKERWVAEKVVEEVGKIKEFVKKVV